MPAKSKVLLLSHLCIASSSFLNFCFKCFNHWITQLLLVLSFDSQTYQWSYMLLPFLFASSNRPAGLPCMETQAWLPRRLEASNNQCFGPLTVLYKCGSLGCCTPSCPHPMARPAWWPMLSILGCKAGPSLLKTDFLLCGIYSRWTH